MEEKREFIDLKKRIRAQALILCFSERYDEKMWKKYAGLFLVLLPVVYKIYRKYGLKK